MTWYKGVNLSEKEGKAEEGIRELIKDATGKYPTRLKEESREIYCDCDGTEVKKGIVYTDRGIFDFTVIYSRNGFLQVQLSELNIIRRLLLGLKAYFSSEAQ